MYFIHVDMLIVWLRTTYIVNLKLQRINPTHNDMFMMHLSTMTVKPQGEKHQ